MLRPALLIATFVTTSFAARLAQAQNEMVFAPAADGTISFILPSGNIGCTFVPAGGTAVYHTANGYEELHCTRVEPSYVVVVMQDHLGGHEPITQGEAPGLSQAPVLPYGHFWQGGAFTCLAGRNGLTCINASGAGLGMARAGVVTW